MKYSLVAIALIALMWPAPPACGQYGLSGSPEFLALSANSAGAQQPANSFAAAPPVVSFDPAMRPISQTALSNVSLGYHGAPGPLTTGPAAPLTPPVPPPAPNTYQPTLPPLNAAGQQSPSLTNQMLNDPNLANGNCWSGYGNGPALGGACAAPGPGCGVPSPSCAPSCELGPCLYQPQWYASAAGLIMSRNQANRVWTTYETNNNPNQLLNTQDASAGWQGGYEVTLGRMFCCNRWAIELSYWWLAEMNSFAEVPERNYDFGSGSFSYSTPLSFDNVVWANGATPTPAGIFDFARQHRIWRRDSFQNLELNLIRHQLAPGDGPMTIDWSVGARYFRFDEQLRVGALQQSVTADPVHYWGEAGGQYEAYLNDSIKNSLVGFQFGLSAVYPVAPSFRLFVAPKFGIYNNHIENRFSGYRGDGLLMAPDPASGVPGSFPTSSSTDALAFLTEVNLGVDWNFAPRWTAFAGYRVIWATGIGLADNQYIPYVVDIPGHQHIETNGELVLHGAFAGLTFCF